MAKNTSYYIGQSAKGHSGGFMRGQFGGGG